MVRLESYFRDDSLKFVIMMMFSVLCYGAVAAIAI